MSCVGKYRVTVRQTYHHPWTHLSQELVPRDTAEKRLITDEEKKTGNIHSKREITARTKKRINFLRDPKSPNLGKMGVSCNVFYGSNFAKVFVYIRRAGPTYIILTVHFPSSPGIHPPPPSQFLSIFTDSSIQIFKIFRIRTPEPWGQYFAFWIWNCGFVTRKLKIGTENMCHKVKLMRWGVTVGIKRDNMLSAFFLTEISFFLILYSPPPSIGKFLDIPLVAAFCQDRLLSMHLVDQTQLLWKMRTLTSV